jgi:hypothetical protein
MFVSHKAGVQIRVKNRVLGCRNSTQGKIPWILSPASGRFAFALAGAKVGGKLEVPILCVYT